MGSEGCGRDGGEYQEMEVKGREPWWGTIYTGRLKGNPMTLGGGG